LGTLGEGLNAFCIIKMNLWGAVGGLFWFKYEMSPISSCVEGLVLSW
jgi:hypothetical protein